MIVVLTSRQEKIAEIVQDSGPIAGEQIAERLNVTRAALRSDLAILVMAGILDARPKVGYFFTGNSTLSMLSQAIANVRVRDIQSVPVVVPAEMSAYDVIVTLFLEDVGTVFVVEQGILIGVISRKDLLKACIGNSDLQKIPVKVLMTAASKLVVTTAEEPILLAAKKIIDSEVDSLPVVRPIGATTDKNYEVVGRLTKTNLAKLLVEFGEGKRG